jgi:hypothetical protein
MGVIAPCVDHDPTRALDVAALHALRDQVAPVHDGVGIQHQTAARIGEEEAEPQRQDDEADILVE